MPTIHYTKKQFIENLEKTIGDDEHIIVTTDVDGDLEILKKRHVRRIPFVFANDAFKTEDSLKDILKSKLLSVAIVPGANIAAKFKKKKK